MQRIKASSARTSSLSSQLGIGLLFLLAANFGPTANAQTTPVSFTSPPTADSVIYQVNSHIEQGWRDFEIEPSKDAQDGPWCRRVFLDVIGRIPTVAEVEKFLDSKDPDKKKQLVESLLYDDKYTEEFARNWTTIWSNLLIGRTGGTERNTMTVAKGCKSFFAIRSHARTL